jgi:hypothetical protein
MIICSDILEEFATSNLRVNTVHSAYAEIIDRNVPPDDEQISA